MPIQERASDSSRFTRRDQDSLQGGIQTHPGIDENGVLAMAVPRTNRQALLVPTGTGLRIRWAGVRIPPGAPLFHGLPEPDPCRGVKRLVFRVASPATADVSDAQSVGLDSQMPAPSKLTSLRCPRPRAGSI